MKSATKKPISNAFVEETISDIFEDSLHAKRITSISNATLGVMNSLSLAIHMIGAGLAQAKDLHRKHCIKQVDRLLSNSKIPLWELFPCWVKYILGERTEVKIAMDWTDFERDNHSTIVLSTITEHGRATPLIWKTFEQNKLKNNRNLAEDEVLHKLRECLESNIKVTIVADRGFGDIKLFEELTNSLNFEYVIRIKDNIWITDSNNVQKKAKDWLIKGGRIQVLKDALITDSDYKVSMFLCTKQKDMKDAWYLVSSLKNVTPNQVIVIYGKRWGIETSFRDIKDYKFGMGMNHMHTKSKERRDKLFLLSAISITLLTLLGAAGDAIGLERFFKANTVKTRTYSFWRQGCMYYEMAGSIKKDYYERLMIKFYELMKEQQCTRNILGIV